MPGPFQTIRSRRDFKKLYDEGRAYHGEHFVLIVRRTDETPGKVAFVTSRRVGNAVRRNRARRLLREALRTLEIPIERETIHAAFIARASCAGATLAAVRDDMKRILCAAELPAAHGERKMGVTDA